MSLAWEAPDCQHRNGEYGGFRYVLRRVTDDTHPDPVVATETINRTELTLADLVPYTAYTVQLAFVNHVGEGPMSELLELTTLEGREYWEGPVII